MKATKDHLFDLALIGYGLEKIIDRCVAIGAKSRGFELSKALFYVNIISSGVFPIVRLHLRMDKFGERFLVIEQDIVGFTFVQIGAKMGYSLSG